MPIIALGVGFPHAALVRLVRDNAVDSGLTGGGDARGARRGTRSFSRNPKNILSVVAADASLEIPRAFVKMVRPRRSSSSPEWPVCRYSTSSVMKGHEVGAGKCLYIGVKLGAHWRRFAKQSSITGRYE